ncbi:MAG: DNA polymerase III subunit delta' [Proteobacteria bacterium]|nr:DNA polymerase III subunit delta' [Pseudomonadota bacterium]
MGFDSIIGHEKQKSMLLSLLEKERLPHAFLFSGPEGIGKKKVVLEFAKHILCDKGFACGVCRPCIKIDRGSHPDILQVGNEESIGIEQSRSISKEVYEYPYESQRRIIIIDNAERMTREAKNALLKTLEEPPSFNIFFLTTPSERDIPLTIRSRCMRLVFSPLHREQLKEYFKSTLLVNNEKAELLSYISHGSIGSGLFWTMEENFSLRRKIAELVLGKNKSFLRASVIAEKVAKNQREMTMFLSFILSLYRDIYCVRECGDTAMIVNKDIRELLEWEKINLVRINTSIQRIEHTINLLRYNVNKWLIFENLMLRLMESA